MANLPPKLNEIYSLAPHAGQSFLLTEMLDYDEHEITCRATSHRDPNNPLRAHGHLHAIAGIEYCGQAIAIHNTLTDPLAQGKARIGFFGSLSDVKLQKLRLDDIEEDLIIRCECLISSPKRILYRFELGTTTESILSGRASLVLR